MCQNLANNSKIPKLWSILNCENLPIFLFCGQLICQSKRFIQLVPTALPLNMNNFESDLTFICQTLIYMFDWFISQNKGLLNSSVMPCLHMKTVDFYSSILIFLVDWFISQNKGLFNSSPLPSRPPVPTPDRHRTKRPSTPEPKRRTASFGNSEKHRLKRWGSNDSDAFLPE